ncbi:MAG: hypothetical protein H7Z72_06320 [Bacteroidetes bacterium]|nr:hypothetical protein [Fibrella sp.]
MNPPRLLLTLLVLGFSCQPKSKQETQTGSAATQPDSTALLTKRPGPDAPRTAADRLVRALYFEHNKTENPFRETKDRALIDQFFAKPTADLIWSAAQQSVGSVKTSVRNPLFDAPDKAVRKIWVEPAAVGGSRAVVYVTFTNNARPEEIRLDMQQVGGRWRITDMLYPGGKQLTQRLLRQ